MTRRVLAVLASLLAMASVSVDTAASASAASGIRVSCFGYTGTFKNPTSSDPYTVAKVTWANKSQNCFGVAPNRHIYDTSPGHPWYEIPGGGRADGISLPPDGDGSTYKTYIVHVDSGDQFYYQTWYSTTGWTRHWSRL